MQTPLVSAVTLNFRTGKVAVECVQRLLNQSIADQMEVIVVDNFSEDDSVGIIRNALDGHPQVRIVETAGNFGFGTGYNEGISYARGEYLMINNPAKKLEPEGIEKMVQRMQSDPSIGIVAPRLVHDDGSERTSARRFPRPLDLIIKRTALGRLFPERLRRYLQLDADPDTERESDWIAGGCFMIRRDVFEQLGGFDDRFFLFFEDTDLCRRCQEAGKKVLYMPSVTGTDRKSRLSDGGIWMMVSTKVGRAHIRSALKYFAKWGVN